MKKMLAALIMLAAAAGAHADETRYVNADGSTLSDLCIAAIESDKTVAFLAKELGLAPVRNDEVLCNGKPIRSFVDAMHTTGDQKIVAYVVRAADSSPETQLCLAALTSKVDFDRLRASHFANVSVEREVTCNSAPLQQFVRRYQDQLANAAGKETAAR